MKAPSMPNVTSASAIAQLSLRAFGNIGIGNNHIRWSGTSPRDRSGRARHDLVGGGDPSWRVPRCCAGAAAGGSIGGDGRPLPAADGLGRADPAQSGDPGGELCRGGVLRSRVPGSAAEFDRVEDARAALAPVAAAVARDGADTALPARYLAQPPAECILSARLGSAANRGFAAQLLVSAGSTLRYAVSRYLGGLLCAKYPAAGMSLINVLLLLTVGLIVAGVFSALPSAPKLYLP